MSVTFDQYKTAIINPIKHQIFKLEFMDKEENIINEIITDMIDGSISIQLQNGVRRTCNLTLKQVSELLKTDAVQKQIKEKVGEFLNAQPKN